MTSLRRHGVSQHHHCQVHHWTIRPLIDNTHSMCCAHILTVSQGCNPDQRTPHHLHPYGSNRYARVGLNQARTMPCRHDSHSDDPFGSRAKIAVDVMKSLTFLYLHTQPSSSTTTRMWWSVESVPTMPSSLPSALRMNDGTRLCASRRATNSRSGEPPLHCVFYNQCLPQHVWCTDSTTHGILQLILLHMWLLSRYHTGCVFYWGCIVQLILVLVLIPHSGRAKFVFLTWVGESVSAMKKAVPSPPISCFSIGSQGGGLQLQDCPCLHPWYPRLVGGDESFHPRYADTLTSSLQ